MFSVRHICHWGCLRRRRYVEFRTRQHGHDVCWNMSSLFTNNSVSIVRFLDIILSGIPIVPCENSDRYFPFLFHYSGTPSAFLFLPLVINFIVFLGSLLSSIYCTYNHALSIYVSSNTTDQNDNEGLEGSGNYIGWNNEIVQN